MDCPSTLKLISVYLTWLVSSWPNVAALPSADAEKEAAMVELAKLLEIDPKVQHMNPRVTCLDGQLGIFVDYLAQDELSLLTNYPISHLFVKSSAIRDVTPLSTLPLRSLSLVHLDRRTRSRLNMPPIGPIKGLETLPRDTLSCLGLSNADVVDLPMLNMFTNLTYLTLDGSMGVSNLQPIAGLPLRWLSVVGTDVVDLSPLKGMPLEHLNLTATGVRDLSPLAEMRLLSLNISNSPVSSLEPLSGMPLERLRISGTTVQDLSPLHRMPLQSLRMEDSAVTNILPVCDSPLEYLSFTPGRITVGLDALRRVETLSLIKTSPGNLRFSSVSNFLEKACSSPRAPRQPVARALRWLLAGGSPLGRITLL